MMPTAIGKARDHQPIGASARSTCERRRILPMQGSNLACTWQMRGFVPIARAPEIEKLSGVPRSQLIDPCMLKLIRSF